MATGTTGPAAERALKVKLRDRTTPNDDEITRETRVSKLADLWIEEITTEERIAPQAIQRYETSTRIAMLPALGNLRIREASVGRLDRFLPDIAKDHPSAAKGAKVLPSQMSALAVRHGAIPTNPVRDTGRLRKPRRAVVALTDENLQAVRTAIRDWQRPVPGKPGPRHSGDLADIVDLMLATHQGRDRHEERRSTAWTLQRGGHRHVLHRQVRPSPGRLGHPRTTRHRPRAAATSRTRPAQRCA